MPDVLWDETTPTTFDGQGIVWDYVAPTREQRFFWRTGAHDMGYGTDVRSMEETAPGGGFGATSIQYTATNEVWKVVDPGNANSNIASSEANRKLYGLALNEDAPAPAMGSVAGARRFIPEGTWSYSVFISAASTPALVSTYRIRARLILYRVSADGTTLTLLQEMNASQFETRSATSNAPYTLTAGAGSVPEIILEPGETIHTAWEILSSATQAALGAVTNTTITVDLNNSASWVQVPSPGILTEFARSRDMTGVGTQDRAIRVRKDHALSAVGTQTFDRALVLARAFAIDGVGTQDRDIRVRKTLQPSAVGTQTRTIAIGKAPFAIDAVGTLDKTIRVRKDITITGVGTQAFDRALVLTRSFDVSATGTVDRDIRVRKTLELSAAGSQSMDRSLILARSHDVSAVGVQTRAIRVRKTVVPSAVGTETMDRSLILARSFDVSAVGSESFARVVTFVRSFDVSAVGSLADRNAVRICVPTGALTGPDGAGTTTIIRPVIIFDD